VKATQAILKPRWKLVDGLAKALLDNEGSMHGAELQEWCIQVEPHTDHDELLARLNKTMMARKHKWFVRVEDDLNGRPLSTDHLTFFADDEEDLRECLLGFVRHEMDRKDHADEEIADFLEDIGVKVDLKDPCFEDIYDEQAPAIINYFFNNDPQYTIVDKSPALKWLQPKQRQQRKSSLGSRPGRRCADISGVSGLLPDPISSNNPGLEREPND
jgi:hypothetical protein